MPAPRVALRSLACLALAGCTRGCGADAEPCDNNGDCRPAAPHGIQTAGPITTSSRFHPLYTNASAATLWPMRNLKLGFL